MPRLPVDGKKVSELRISLSGVERQALEDFIVANNINKVGTPLVALISDVSAMAFLITAYSVYRYGDDALDYFQEQYNNLGMLYKDFILVSKGLPVIREINFGLDLLSRLAGTEIPDLGGDRSGPV
jgi:hypothetical protein